MSRILVTGASGFVGAALVRALAAKGFAVRAAYRRAPAGSAGDESVIVGDLGADMDWSAALRDISAIVHLAGPAHARFGEAYLHRAIVEGAAGLAAQAEAAGIERFVFISSIKAAAASTGSAISERDSPHPADAYGRAKLAAERALLAHAALRPVVLRSSLVFAANAKANFAQLLRLADTGLALPLAGIRNKRSLLSLSSLLDAIMAVLRKPYGASGIFHIADEPALSTPHIVAALRRGMGRPERLFRAPGLAALTPRALTQSLEADSSAFREAYAWRGADTVAALEACGAAWKAAP